MLTYAAHNTAVTVAALRRSPQSPEAIAALVAAGDAHTAHVVADHARNHALADGAVQFLVRQRNYTGGMFGDEPAPGEHNPALEAMIDAAIAEREAIGREWPAIQARVEAIARRLEDATPGARFADTAVA